MIARRYAVKIGVFDAETQGMKRSPKETPMAADTKVRRLSPSAIVAGSFVLAAAAISWFALAPGASGPEDTEIVTAAGNERPARQIAGVSTGGLPTRIVVPSAGVDTSIAEVGVVIQDGRAAWETAWRAAGHHLDSAMPGQPGNMVITGHVSVADRGNLAVFEQLDRVVEGDIVEVYSGETLYRYSVNKVLTVPPSAVKLLRSDSAATVTLVTCTQDLKNRLVVVGTLIA